MYSYENYTVITDTNPDQFEAGILLYLDEEEFRRRRPLERQVITTTQCSSLLELPCSNLPPFTMEMTAPRVLRRSPPTINRQRQHRWPVVLTQPPRIRRLRGLSARARLRRCFALLRGVSISFQQLLGTRSSSR
jgi:hypothetical protein